MQASQTVHGMQAATVVITPRLSFCEIGFQPIISVRDTSNIEVFQDFPIRFLHFSSILSYVSIRLEAKCVACGVVFEQHRTLL